MFFKIFFYSFCLILIFIISYVAMLTYQQTSAYNGPKSDHFDGSRFFNTPPYRLHNFSDMLKWSFTQQRAKWPVFVNDNAQPDLTPLGPNDLKVTYVNHATVLVQTEHMNILTDPIWSERTSPLSWYGPKRVRAPGIKFENLPPIDLVVVSHNHYDHLDLPTLKSLNDKFHPVILVPLGVKALLNRHGIDNVTELDWWQTYPVKNALITFMPSQHWSARSVTDKCKTLWGSYGIVSDHKRIYFAGDTGYSSHFKLIRAKWGKPDMALLPIGSYDPEWFMQANHMNPQEAVQAHLDLEANQSIGIHFGTFQISDEAIDQPNIDLQQAVETNHLRPGEFLALKNGQTL